MQIIDNDRLVSQLHPSGQRVAAVLVAKSSLTNAAANEMQSLAAYLDTLSLVDHTTFAFSEQGSPSLRETLQCLADQEFDEVVLLPWILPMEPGFQLWATKTVHRWRAADPSRHWPAVRIASSLAATDAVALLLAEMTQAGLTAAAIVQPTTVTSEGSIVPPQMRRVLVCQGGPCNNAGAAVIWGHLRNEQKRLELRTTGGGVMSCKTTCLGPCHLAPVLQVFPESTYYGGVDEPGVDRIIEQHLLGGKVVDELAYQPLRERQYLRA